MLSKRFRTSMRSSKLAEPRSGNRFVTPMSNRVKNGARIRSVRGAQSPALQLDAAFAVGRRDVAALRDAQIRVAGLSRRAGLERPARVQDDVVREHRDDLPARVVRVRIGDDPEEVHLLQILRGHVDQPDVAEVDRPRLDSAGPGEVPVADDPVEDGIHVRAEPMSAADRNRPIPLHLDGMPDVVVGNQHAPVAEPLERR